MSHSCHHLSWRIATALVALALSSGCLASRYRFVDAPQPPGQAVAGLEDAARQQGFSVHGWQDGGCGALICGEDLASLARPRAAPPDGGAPDQDFIIVTAAEARDGGARIELRPGYDTSLDALRLPAEDHAFDVEPKPYEQDWTDPFVYDFELALLAARDPARSGITWRADFAGQMGSRIASWGTPSESSWKRTSMSLLAGPGLKVGPTGPALMPELTLELDRQAMVSPVRSARLPVGPRYAMDLTVAGLFLDDEKQLASGGYSHRQGLELGFNVRRTDLFGVTARVGRTWGNDPGWEGALGVRVLDPELAGAITIIGGGLATIVYLLVTHPPTPGPPSKG